jgi:DNA-binding PadR family transcriptional regulator
MTERAPSTATFALLGLLAMRPWTGYELTRQLRRSLHYAWPRSEANLYAEQKQLVGLGWARVTKEPVGRRTRNRYEITPAGRRALRAWMRTVPDAPRLEVEGIVRMFFADRGSVEDLTQAIRSTGERAGDAVLELCEIVQDYFVTGGPFPRRLHAIALAADLVTDLLARIESYSRHAAAEVVRWDTTRDRGLTMDARKRFQEILGRGERIARARGRLTPGVPPRQDLRTRVRRS